MSVPAWAVRGREVVCIKDGWSDNWCRLMGAVPPDRVPMLNEVLRIEEVLVDPSPIVIGCFLSFEGIPPFLYEVSNFRPLVTLETDLKAHFAHHLDAPVRVSEEA